MNAYSEKSNKGKTIGRGTNLQEAPTSAPD